MSNKLKGKLGENIAKDSKNTFGMPFEAITKAKLEKITSSALFYLANCAKKYDSYRLSAISILGDKIDFIESILI